MTAAFFEIVSASHVASTFARERMRRRSDYDFWDFYIGANSGKLAPLL